MFKFKYITLNLEYTKISTELRHFEKAICISEMFYKTLHLILSLFFNIKVLFEGFQSRKIIHQISHFWKMNLWTFCQWFLLLCFVSFFIQFHISFSIFMKKKIVVSGNFYHVIYYHFIPIYADFTQRYVFILFGRENNLCVVCWLCLIFYKR